MLLDNETWEEGVQVVEAHDWLRDNSGTWGVRWFALIVPRPTA